MEPTSLSAPSEPEKERRFSLQKNQHTIKHIDTKHLDAYAALDHHPPPLATAHHPPSAQQPQQVSSLKKIPNHSDKSYHHNFGLGIDLTHDEIIKHEAAHNAKIKEKSSHLTAKEMIELKHAKHMKHIQSSSALQMHRVSNVLEALHDQSLATHKHVQEKIVIDQLRAVSIFDNKNRKSNPETTTIISSSQSTPHLLSITKETDSLHPHPNPHSKPHLLSINTETDSLHPHPNPHPKPKSKIPRNKNRHKLKAAVLRKLDDKMKAHPSKTNSLMKSHFRGLGANVSLFSKQVSEL